MKLLSKQEHAIYYLKDSDTTEILYGGAAFYPPLIYLGGGDIKLVVVSPL
jgi:hypothetical protein